VSRYTIDAQVYLDGVWVGSGFGAGSSWMGAVDDLASCLANDPPSPKEGND